MSQWDDMVVIKRNGTKEAVNFDKVNGRLSALNKYPYQLRVNSAFVAQKVIATITPGIKTSEIDEYAARVANELGVMHPDYQILAARIAISNHQKNTNQWGSFSSAMEVCYRNKSVAHAGKDAPRINTLLYKFSQIHKDKLDKMVEYSRDFGFSYFGFTTLLDRYLLKRSGPRDMVNQRPQDYVIERPQDMWMRIACALHMNRLDLNDTRPLAKIQESYELLSQGYMSHATPTMYNAGTMREQLLSCFLCAGGDSIEEDGGIFDLIKNVGTISKYAGGVGFWWDLRHTGAEVKSTNGISGGMGPFLKIMESTALAVDQGGKRKGSFAHFLGPTHPFWREWLELRRSTGAIPNLYYGAWIPDVFMETVKDKGTWYFFDPVDYPALYNSYGKEFTRLYHEGVEKKLYCDSIDVLKLWSGLLKTQIETGMPYMCSQDKFNEMSNQKNLGIIKSSNLCTEIAEVSTPKSYACCCVAAMCLPKYAKVTYSGCMHKAQDGHNKECKREFSYDYLKLAQVTGVMVMNLNRVIDINYYPVKETEQGNKDTRPLAIGIQGEADVAMMARLPFTDPKFQVISKTMMEAIYYGALRTSCDLAKRYGPYKGFEGSPFSKGIFQFDMYGLKKDQLSGLFDWNTLRADVIKYGVRNSLLTSLPPTASTSHIQGNNECFEPYTDMVYIRKTLSGEFPVINHHLINHMIEEQLWDLEIKDQIIAGRGSVQHIDRLPKEFKDIYKTVWEYKTRDLVDMAYNRQLFTDQSMSLNQWIVKPSIKILTSLYFYCWEKGLKTWMYYLRSKSDSTAVQFSTSAENAANLKILGGGKVVECSGESCTSCSV